MKVAKFMVPAEKLVTAAPSATVREVAKLLNDHHIGCVVVVDESKEGVLTPLGLVSKGDIARVVATSGDPDTVKASEVCSHGLHTISGDAPRDDAADKMMKDKLHHLVVVDGAGQLSGLISSWDVAREAALDAKAWPYSRDAAFFQSGF